MDVEEYFSSGPEFERPVFDAVRTHMVSLDADIYYESVSVGIFFKRRTSFLQLRTMTRWVAVCFSLDRKLDSERLSRKVIENGQRWFHVINITKPDQIDDELTEWLTEAWSADE